MTVANRSATKTSRFVRFRTVASPCQRDKYYLGTRVAAVDSLISCAVGRGNLDAVADHSSWLRSGNRAQYLRGSKPVMILVPDLVCRRSRVSACELRRSDMEVSDDTAKLRSRTQSSFHRNRRGAPSGFPLPIFGEGRSSALRCRVSPRRVRRCAGLRLNDSYGGSDDDPYTLTRK